MNILLFQSAEIEAILPLDDPRAEHLLNVLRRQPGEEFDAGVVDGPKGKGRVEYVGQDGLLVSFSWRQEEAPLWPIDLIVGLSRPQTNRKILQEATSLGVRSMSFVTTERGESSYASSRLWTTEEWRRHLIAGAEQAFSTRLPIVRRGLSLDEACGSLALDARRVALDNYEAELRVGAAVAGAGSLALAVGSERGWTGPERECLRRHGFRLAHLGERVLRTETAVVAAVAIARELLG